MSFYFNLYGILVYRVNYWNDFKTMYVPLLSFIDSTYFFPFILLTTKVLLAPE